AAGKRPHTQTRPPVQPPAPTARTCRPRGRLTKPSTGASLMSEKETARAADAAPVRGGGTDAASASDNGQQRKGRLPGWATGFGAQVIAGLIVGLILGFIARGQDGGSGEGWLT